LEAEKGPQTKFKQESQYFSDAARAPGIYRDHPREFCIPSDLSQENLFPLIREDALRYFSDHGIAWHQGAAGGPSNHLCDSQVCCVNFLFPFADNPGELLELLRPVFPSAASMLPVEDSMYVTFEWIGNQNYLGERVGKHGHRTRGANCTSADAIVRFRAKTGEARVVLIEWKYTESYSAEPKRFADSGTDRLEIYRALLERPDCPIHLPAGMPLDALFYEPFYQLMRLQLLAHEMELHKDLDATAVSVLHISPRQNVALGSVTSPALQGLGTDVVDVWLRIVQDPGRFTHVETQSLFAHLRPASYSALAEWWEYISQRYRWLAA
jgi:hypothetical protein